LLTDQDEISNLYRGPSIDASYQVSVHLAKQFQRRRFLKNQQYLYRVNCILNTDTLYLYLNNSYLSFNRGEDFLEINQSKTRIACGGHVCQPIRTK